MLNRRSKFERFWWQPILATYFSAHPEDALRLDDLFKLVSSPNGMSHQTFSTRGMAASALIFDLESQLLLLVSNVGVGSDTWVLPGGGIKKGESPTDSVRRHIWEAIGLATWGAVDDEAFVPVDIEPSNVSTLPASTSLSTLYDFKYAFFASSRSVLKPQGHAIEARWVSVASETPNHLERAVGRVLATPEMKRHDGATLPAPRGRNP